MSTRDYTANVISATPVVPDGNFKDSKASGVWDINEALDLIKGGNWPNVANINPAAFVDALFQTHLYTGTDATNSIVNNIDLAGKGGLVWVKARTTSVEHVLYDTERGATKMLQSNGDNAETTQTNGLSSFNSNGFTVQTNGNINGGHDYVSWTFRKQPKFFDVVTYTGTSSPGTTVNHNLGSVPGMIMVKCLSHGSSNWRVYHRGNHPSDPEDYALRLNATSAQGDSDSYWNDTAPTSTQFTLGGDDDVNDFGDSYVAYLFAHNNNDGGFGAAEDQDIIKCGNYTGNGNATGPEITLGFEPQFLMIKSATSDPSGNGDWLVADSMRGLNVTDTTKIIYWNRTNAEQNASGQFEPTSTGFKITSTHTSVNDNGTGYIYMAIRRGGMQTPTAATQVFFQSTASSGTALSVGFVPDFWVGGNRNGGASMVMDRLRGSKYMSTSSTAAEQNTNDPLSGAATNTFTNNSAGGSRIEWLWRRAPSYFDAVTYDGNQTSGRTVSHNLGVAPEMMWVKRRSNASDWKVYHSALGNTKHLNLNENIAAATDSSIWNDTTPTASVFTLGYDIKVNGNNDNFIAYLFATVAGVSKLGSFTQSGATNVDCGFTGDTPSLVIYKRTDSAGNWHIYDSARGIVAGNDAYLLLDTTDNEQSSDYIDPYSGGFATTSGVTDGDYIFYAIAAIS